MIIRVKKNTNFTVIDNTPLRHTGLSWKAKGLIAYLLTLPDNWEINIEDLTKRSKDGRDATASALREIIKAGFCVRTRVAEKGKFKKYDYTIFESGTEKGEIEGIEISEKPKEKVKKMAPGYVSEIFEFYKTLGLVNHRTLTDKQEKAIIKAVKQYGQDIVLQAIENYSIVYHGTDFYFSYLWTLEDFLNRGLGKFISDAKPLENFLSNKKKNGIIGKPVDLKIELR